MSGIVGIIDRKSSNELKLAIKKMADVLKHRGLQAEGFFVQQNIALGLRLSSFPDRPTDRQPATFADFTIILDGEIYNWQTLQTELKNEGHKFTTQTDAEIIVAAYRQWGEKSLEKFNGSWAFVIYDHRKKILFGARDRFGIKPLFYYWNQPKFIFASEIKAILTHPEILAQPNEKIVWDYLVCGMVDHSRETFFIGIKEFGPGQFFTYRDNHLTIKEYYHLGMLKKLFNHNSTYAVQFKELLIDSIRLRLPAKDPIGTALSGGLDSSSIVCIIDHILGRHRQQQTFSARFQHTPLDENKFIREVIKKTRVADRQVFIQGKGMKQSLKKIIWHQEMPFCSTGMYAEWQVLRQVQQAGISVFLEGVGSDGLLAGYTPFVGIYIAELLKEFRFGAAIKELFYYKRNHGSIFELFQELFIKSIHYGFIGKSLAKIMRQNWQEYDLFEPSFLKKYTRPPLGKFDQNIFRNSMLNDFHLGMNSLLRYEDRSASAFNLTPRLPFLDHRLVDFCFSLPDDQKIKYGETKWVMREAMKGILPELIRTRQDKIGFTSPGEMWLRNDLKNEILTVFQSKKFQNRGYFNGPATVALFQQFLYGKTIDYKIFWRIYNLEMWFRIFID